MGYQIRTLARMTSTLTGVIREPTSSHQFVTTNRVSNSFFIYCCTNVEFVGKGAINSTLVQTSGLWTFQLGFPLSTAASCACLNCLGTDHSIKQCGSKLSCWESRGRHHTLLHKLDNSSSARQQNNSSESTPPTTTTTLTAQVLDKTT